MKSNQSGIYHDAERPSYDATHPEEYVTAA